MTAKNQINMLDIKSTFDHAFGNELHDKRKLSLSYAALGVLESEYPSGELVCNMEY